MENWKKKQPPTARPTDPPKIDDVFASIKASRIAQRDETDRRSFADLEEEIITGVHDVVKGELAKVVAEVRAKQPSGHEIHVHTVPIAPKSESVPAEAKLAWKHRHALLHIAIWCASGLGLGALATKILTALGVMH